MKHLTKKQNIFLGLVFFIASSSYSQIDQNPLFARAPRIDAQGNTNVSVVGPIPDCNTNNILAVLGVLKKSINSCCAELNNDFRSTFTVLADIQNTFTSCCSTIQNDVIGTFTSLDDILSTLTACCNEITNEFNQTWTILAAGFNETFISSSEVKTTLTTCCQQIETNFINLFVGLENLITACTGNGCNAIPITTPITIAAPGSYCLANDITGSIIINASNVTLDLNNHTISGMGLGGGNGIVVNSGSNRVIKNGRITNVDTGIMCTNNIQTFMHSIVIETAFVEGITVNNGSTIHLDSLITTSILGIAVHFTGNNNRVLIDNTTITISREGFVFDTISNGLLKNCNVLDCGTPDIILTGNTVGGFTVITGNSLQFKNCSVKNYIGVDSVAAFSLNTNVSNVIFKNCTVQNIIATLPSSFASIAVGFNCGVTNNIHLYNCTVIDAVADFFSVGFLLAGTNITAENCIARRFTTLTISPAFGNSIGFQINDDNVTLKNCEAYECTQDGFLIAPTGIAINVSLIQCQAAYNSFGFRTNSSDTIFDHCVAFNNDTGFSSSVAGTSPFRCFASQNTTNYGGSLFNTQNANTQVNNTALGLTGPFAGGNLFM